MIPGQRGKLFRAFLVTMSSQALTGVQKGYTEIGTNGMPAGGCEGEMLDLIFVASSSATSSSYATWHAMKYVPNYDGPCQAWAITT